MLAAVKPPEGEIRDVIVRRNIKQLLITNP